MKSNYKEYYINNVGYNSNKIENNKLSFPLYKEYYNYSLLELDNALNKDKHKYIDKEITMIEIYNFKKAVNVLFKENKIDDWMNQISLYNKTLLTRLNCEPYMSHSFKALKANGSQNIGLIRTTNLSKGFVNFMSPELLKKNLDIINKRITKVLSSNKLSLEEKINEIILYHLNFEFIHPFVEGNGRTGRLIMDQQLFSLNLPSINYQWLGNTYVQYLTVISDVLDQHQYLYGENLFQSVPSTFLQFSWWELKKEKERLNKEGLKFEALNKLNIDKIVTKVFENNDLIDKEYEAKQRTLKDEDLIKTY
ncbi:Fic family protein [Mesoplasma lactucae]|nr:Fic family protein [Mesoplasma lactucae]ATZ20415.1 hypothetical protein MLACT_v1c05940 [Mesoplasma lactucae ATCC 49193]MCL8216586.1 hypothetical protein [Mesoplasma lactucae ATCC 49193]